MSVTLIDHSKTAWVKDEGSLPTYQEIQIGCLQRLATTMESLSRSWCGVQEQNVRFRMEIKTLENQNRALRGQITKLNKRVRSG